MKTTLILLMSFIFSCAAHAQESPLPVEKLSALAQILADSKVSEWRALDPNNTLYLELPNGRVVIELAPEFAPKHVANVKALAAEHYWDGLAVVRVQDNYVAQWADPDAEKPDKKRKIKNAKEALSAEFDRAIESGLPFARLPDGDVYAQEVGFTDGFPAARDYRSKRTWLIHCYGMVGAGRDVSIDSGGGTELYAVIGHSPRHLDRNVTLLGRVVQGMEYLSSLPRGKGAMGFYEKPEEQIVIRSAHLASEVPESERVPLEVLKTDSKSFQKLVIARRNRREEWFHDPVGHVEICNVPVPVRKTLGNK